MSDAQIRTLSKFIELQNNNACVHAVRAAMELGIFASLSDGQKEAAQIAKTCGLAEKPTKSLLDLLCHLEIIEKYGDDFALAPVMRMVEGWNDFGESYWKHLVNYLRTGESIAVSDPETSDSDYRASALSREWIMTPSALSVAEVLEIGKSRRGLNILDLGCGAAVYSMTMLHIDPTAQATLVDWPVAIEQAANTAKSVDRLTRVQLVGDDYRQPQLENANYDMALLSNVARLHGPDSLKKLLQLAGESLKEGGELVIIDTFPGQSDGDLTRLVGALELTLRTTEGTPPDPSHLTRLVEETGFRKPTYAHLPVEPFTMGVMVAAKG